MTHLTPADRVAKAETLDTIRYMLDMQPFLTGRVVVEDMERNEFCAWDFETRAWGHRIGLGEVCLWGRTRAEMKDEGWAIDKARLNLMYRATGGNARALECMFAIRTSDDKVLYTMLRWLLKQRDSLKETSAEGSNPGLLVPGWLLHDAGEVNI